MSVDEMIEYIGNEIYSIEMFERIKAALNAAQDMHNGYTILERQARQCGFLDSMEHEKLLKAWEAATETI